MQLQDFTDIVKVQERGQITIPVELREKLGIEKGGKLVISIQSDAVVLEPIKKGRREQLSRVAEATIGSVDLKKHREWKTPYNMRKWMKSIRSEWT